MKTLIAALMITVPAIVQPAFAEERATMEEAKTMALAAAAYVTEHGPEAAKAAFMTPGGEWHDRDLYVFAMNDEGKLWAHGANPNLLDRDLSGLTDVSGKEFVREMMAIQTEGWVEYLWENPQTKEIELKASYMVRAGEGWILGVGAYKE